MKFLLITWKNVNVNAVNVKEDKFVDYPSHKASDIIQIHVLL